MPHLARHLAIAACFVVGTAHAAPKKTKKPVEVVKVIDEEDEAPAEEASDEEEVEAPKPKKTKKKAKQKRQAIEESSDEELVEPVKLRKRTKKGLRDWKIAVGPNMWLASVDAKFAVGDKSVGTAIDFLDLQRHTKFAVPLLVEGRYKRFSFVGDLMYGLIGLQGGNEVGGLMLTVDGKVSSTTFDGMGGYRVYGKDDSAKLTLEARSGIRYQRNVISASVGLGDSGFSAAPMVDSAADFLAGARVFVRPTKWFYFTGTADQSLFGSSTSTWSAGIEANARLGSWVLVGAGWRTLTQQKEALSTVMHGPKFTVQVTF